MKSDEAETVLSGGKVKCYVREVELCVQMVVQACV